MEKQTREQKVKLASNLCRLLANENRMLILCYLSERSMNVSELQGCIPAISQSALSQHLAILRTNEIVACEKVGASMIYHLLDGKAAYLVNTLHNLYQCNEDS